MGGMGGFLGIWRNREKVPIQVCTLPRPDTDRPVPTHQCTFEIEKVWARSPTQKKPHPSYASHGFSQAPWRTRTGGLGLEDSDWTRTGGLGLEDSDWRTRTGLGLDSDWLTRTGGLGLEDSDCGPGGRHPRRSSASPGLRVPSGAGRRRRRRCWPAVGGWRFSTPRRAPSALLPFTPGAHPVGWRAGGPAGRYSASGIGAGTSRGSSGRGAGTGG